MKKLRNIPTFDQLTSEQKEELALVAYETFELQRDAEETFYRSNGMVFRSQLSDQQHNLPIHLEPEFLALSSMISQMGYFAAMCSDILQGAEAEPLSLMVLETLLEDYSQTGKTPHSFRNRAFSRPPKTRSQRSLIYRCVATIKALGELNHKQSEAVALVERWLTQFSKKTARIPKARTLRDWVQSCNSGKYHTEYSEWYSNFNLLNIYPTADALKAGLKLFVYFYEIKHMNK